MSVKNLKSLDLSKLADKKSVYVSTQKALSDVTPMNWSKEVLTGKKKIVITDK